jgi:hypothetical protein
MEKGRILSAARQQVDNQEEDVVGIPEAAKREMRARNVWNTVGNRVKKGAEERA